MTLGRAFIHAAKRRPAAFCMADSTGQELSFSRVLTAAILLSGAIRRVAPDQQHVGLLLPASVGGALANVAATLAGKIPVNLNFTAGHDAMAAAIERCGISTILTARGFVAKAGIETLPGMVFVEDFLKQIPLHTKLRTALAVKLLPPSLLARLYAPDGTRRGRDDHFFQRQHRRAQRGGADPPEHPREHRRGDAGVPARRDGRDARRAAVLSRVRLHRHAVAAAGQWLRRRVSPEPDGCQDDWRGGGAIPRHDHDQHADLLLVVHPQDSTRPVRRICAMRSSAPRSCGRPSRRRSRLDSASS